MPLGTEVSPVCSALGPGGSEKAGGATLRSLPAGSFSWIEYSTKVVGGGAAGSELGRRSAPQEHSGHDTQHVTDAYPWLAMVEAS